MAKASFDESVKVLRERGWLGEDESPRVPSRMPQYEDEDVAGVSFFRTEVSDAKLDNLSLPRTFFGRSEIADSSFSNTDLSESNLCWNDFINVDFSGADLSGSDLRASSYENVNFTDANLTRADLRQCDFADCRFDGANLTGAKLTEAGGKLLELAEEQKAAISWQDDEGEEPPGG